MLVPVFFIGPILLQIKFLFCCLRMTCSAKAGRHSPFLSLAHWLACMRLGWLLALGLAPSLQAQAATAFEDSMAQRTLACTACHGPQGKAGPDGYYPRLAGKPADYLYNQLINLRTGRRHYPLMAGLLDTLDDAYLRTLAAYFSGLNVPYPPPAKASGSPREFERGRRLVMQGDRAQGLPACTQCHGLQLTGMAPATPGLLGLPVDYVNAQLGGWQTGQRHAAEPDCMAHVARKLSPSDTSAIAHWLAAQPVPANARAIERKPSALTTVSNTVALPDMRCGSDTAAGPAVMPAAASAAAQPDPVARGAYLAHIGNCAVCHSQPGGMAYGGGRAIATPFGAVYSGNLTPDTVHGIGRWSADDFWRALHLGLSQDGHALYPAFPYTSYTKLSRADADALFAFLKTVPPSTQANRAHALRWPYSTQLALQAWRLLYFNPSDGATAAVPAAVAADRNAAWQRGRYLVQGAGHCLECHGARNALGALSASPAKGGSVLIDGQWFAPSLGDTNGASVAGWSEAEIRTFLQTGRNRQALASGPMAEVVLHGTQYLNDADAQAMAVYLQSLPQAVPEASENTVPASSQTLQRGAKLYEAHCSDCHGALGQGRADVYPALAGNRAVTQQLPNNLINTALQGGFGAATTGHPRPYGMPPFALRLSDSELAAVLSYIRSSWGNHAAPLNEFDINKFRRTQAP